VVAMGSLGGGSGREYIVILPNTLPHIMHGSNMSMLMLNTLPQLMH